MIWIWLAVLIALVVILLRRRTSVKVLPGSTDADVLAALQSHGADLSLPCKINHYLYFPSEAAAKEASNFLVQQGFEVSVRLGSDKKSWLAFGTHTITPTLQAITETRQKMRARADDFGGEYDGWEAALSA